MAKQTAKTGLVAKLGTKLAKAVEAHKGDETKFAGGGVDLPKGIENGIAQLVTCKFGVYEKGDFTGEYYFMASGIVVSPKKHAGIPIEGLRTSIGPEPICETPNKSRKTVDEHIAWVMNELRKLGVDTADLGPDDLETTVEAIQETKPHFRFRTWAGDKRKKGEPGYNEQYDGPNAPDPRVNHQWNGAVDMDSSEEESDEEVEDNTEEESEEVEETEEASADQSNEDLALLADSQDEDAAATLNQIALDAGLEQETIDGTSNWAEVVALIEEAQAAGEEEEEEEEEAEEEAEEESEEESEEVDYATLGSTADEGDEDAQAQLTALAEELGLDPNDSDTYSDWAALAVAVEEANGSEASEEEEEEEEASDEEEIDLDALGASADDSDGEAIEKLTELAKEYELDPDDSETYPDWATLATAIGEASQAGEEAEEFTPTKGGIYMYKPKGAKKAIEVEVTMVGGTTVTAKSLDDGKIFKSVPHEELTVA